MAEETEASYTIDELAAKSGVPSRTIRFYQAKGVLPGPRKRGRVAIYGDSHLERLRIVSELQDKGLRLRAIRDLVTRPEVDRETIQEWLGLGQRIGNWEPDTPALLTEAELRELLGDPRPGMIAHLLRRGGIEPQGEGLSVRYLVKAPTLLRIAGELDRAGIDLDTALGLYDILEKRLGRAAEEVVDFALERLGHGFGQSERPEAVQRAVESLFPSAAGGEAVRIIFMREIQRAVAEHLKGGTLSNQRRPRRR